MVEGRRFCLTIHLASDYLEGMLPAPMLQLCFCLFHFEWCFIINYVANYFSLLFTELDYHVALLLPFLENESICDGYS